MSNQQNREQVWTLPNLISFLRLLVLLPASIVFLLQKNYDTALILLVVSGLTDWLDGFLARRLNQVTQLGKQIDPIADRVSVVLVTLAMTVTGLLPWYFVAMIGTVDSILLTVGWFWFRGAPNTSVSTVGKLRTAILLMALPALIFAAATELEWIRTVGLVLLWAGTVGHVLAGSGYLWQMVTLRTDTKVKSPQL